MVKCVLSTNKYDHYGSPVKVLRNTRPVAMKGRPNTRRFPYPDGTESPRVITRSATEQLELPRGKKLRSRSRFEFE
jgi:hypothetical protein